MGLTERERRALAAMERQLDAQDPRLARRFAAARPRRTSLPASQIALLVLALGTLSLVHALVPDMGGIASALLTVGVIGPWLLFTIRTVPPWTVPWRRGVGRPPRADRPDTASDSDSGDGRPPSCV